MPNEGAGNGVCVPNIAGAPGVPAGVVDAAKGLLNDVLEVGFDDRPGRQRDAPRYNLADRGIGYAPISRTTSPGLAAQADPLTPTTPGTPETGGLSTAVGSDWKTHAKKRSGGRSGKHEYGPLGPLDPGSKF